MADNCAIASKFGGTHSSFGEWAAATLDGSQDMVDAPSSISETPFWSLIKPSSAHKLKRHSRNISSSSKTPVLSATITNLIDEPLFSTYISSEEEGQTPTTDLAIMSSDSVYSYKDALAEFDSDEIRFPELLTDDASYVDQYCVYAQAVQVVAHGPPKVVDLIRADRPKFKRASQMIFQRPQQRPCISPIQTRSPRQVRAVSVSSVSSHSSYSDSDHKTVSTQRSGPTTPVLDEDEPSSPSSDDSPITPKSSFEREDSAQKMASKEDLESVASSNASLRSHSRMPSRLRLFPRRTSSAVVQATQDNKKALPATPPLTPPESAPTGTLRRTKSKFFARGADEREPLLELPPSPTRAQRPSVAPPMPQQSIWKEANAAPKSRGLGFGKSHRIRRVESKMGLYSN